MHTSGGRVNVVINGVSYSARGAIKLNVSNITVTSGSNQNGTNYRTVAPKPRKAEITFDQFQDLNGEPLRWDETIMLLTNIPVTFQEVDGRTTHILTGAFFEGDPGNDLSTGEIDGVTIAADSYKTIQN